jgi:hypothetical protein
MLHAPAPSAALRPQRALTSPRVSPAACARARTSCMSMSISPTDAFCVTTTAASARCCSCRRRRVEPNAPTSLRRAVGDRARGRGACVVVWCGVVWCGVVCMCIADARRRRRHIAVRARVCVCGGGGGGAGPCRRAAMRPTHAPVDVLPPLRQVSRRLQRAQLRRRREVVPQQRRVCWRAERRELHGARVVRERLHAHHLAARRLDQLQRVGLLVVHTHSVAAGAGRVSCRWVCNRRADRQMRRRHCRRARTHT